MTRMESTQHFLFLTSLVLAITLITARHGNAAIDGTYLAPNTLLINEDTGEQTCVADLTLGTDGNVYFNGLSESCNNPVECGEGEFKCTSHDGSTSVCCDTATELCGTSSWGYGKSYAWCYPKDLPSPDDCPEGTTMCSRGQQGDSVACCPQGFSCKLYEGTAWCSPDSQAQCPEGKVHCSKGHKDNTCCWPPPKEKCVKDHGYSWCDADEDLCEAQGPGFQKCGKYCCNPNQDCRDTGWGPEVCTQKTGVDCPPGQEKCTGTGNDYPITICCNAGQCRSSMNGAPTCKDNQYNPPPQCPNPNALQEGSVNAVDTGTNGTVEEAPSQGSSMCSHQGQLSGGHEDFALPLR